MPENLSSEQMEQLRKALGPSLVGQMERLGLQDELKVMASKLEWRGAKPPSAQTGSAFNDSSAPVTPPRARSPPRQMGALERDLKQAVSPSTVASLQAKFMERQIDNRVSPKSKELIKNCLTRSMAGGSSPSRERPASSSKAAPDGVDSVKAALLSDKLKDVLSPSTLNRIRSVLADQADPATPPLPRSPSSPSDAPRHRTPPPHRPASPPRERIPVQQPRSNFPAAWSAPAPYMQPRTPSPPRGGPDLQQLRAAPLAVSTLDALRSYPHLLPAATDGLNGEAGAHLLALAAAALQSSAPGEPYGGVVMRAVAAIDPGLLSALVLVARTARSLPEQRLKVDMISHVLALMGSPSSNLAAEDHTGTRNMLLDTVVSAIETVFSKPDREALLDRLLAKLSADARHTPARAHSPPRAVMSRAPYSAAPPRPNVAELPAHIAHARQLAHSVDQVLRSRSQARAAALPVAAHEARETFQRAHQALEARERTLLQELEQAAKGADHNERLMLQQAEGALQHCEAQLRTNRNESNLRGDVDNAIAQCHKVLEGSTGADARLWVDLEGEDPMFKAIQALGRVRSSIANN